MKPGPKRTPKPDKPPPYSAVDWAFVVVLAAAAVSIVGLLISIVAQGPPK